VLERAACNELAVALALDLSGPAVGAPLLSPPTLLLAPGGALPPAGGDNGRHTSHAWTHWLTLRAQLLLASVGVRLERRMGSFSGPHRPDGPDSPEAAADMSYAAHTEGCRMAFAATEEGEAERILADMGREGKQQLRLVTVVDDAGLLTSHHQTRMNIPVN